MEIIKIGDEYFKKIKTKVECEGCHFKDNSHDCMIKAPNCWDLVDNYIFVKTKREGGINESIC